jgi:NarL family two-component system response regulator LiaR
LIVDDHPLVRKGLCDFLATQEGLEVVGEAGSRAEAVAQAQRLEPDVILMDLVMPDGTGIEAMTEILATAPDTNIVVLTSAIEDEYLFPAMQAGARAYLLKDVEPGEVVGAIRSAIRGHSTLHSAVAQRLVQKRGRNGVDELDELSDREIEVLRRIARGMSNREIAAELFIAEGTVKSHVSNILSKLHLAHRTQAALFALRNKLVPLDEEGG